MGGSLFFLLHYGACNEDYEGHEGTSCHEVWSADAEPSHRISGRVEWLEEQGGERCHRCPLWGCLRRNQKERKLQTRRHVEFEVEEEEGYSSKEGHQPLHQGALCVQSEASLEDCEGTCHEEAEGSFELNFQMFCTSMKLWWAVSLSFMIDTSCTDHIGDHWWHS